MLLVSNLASGSEKVHHPCYIASCLWYQYKCFHFLNIVLTCKMIWHTIQYIYRTITMKQCIRINPFAIWYVPWQLYCIPARKWNSDVTQYAQYFSHDTFQYRGFLTKLLMWTVAAKLADLTGGGLQSGWRLNFSKNYQPSCSINTEV